MGAPLSPSLSPREEGAEVFAGVVACLASGHAPPESSLAQRGEQLRELITLLKPHVDSSSAASWAVHAFERWLTEGGDLQRIMGLRARRGGAHQLPQRDAKRRARDQALRKLASTLPVGNRVKALTEMIRSGHAAVLVIRQEVCEVPSSPAQIARILRGD